MSRIESAAWTAALTLILTALVVVPLAAVEPPSDLEERIRRTRELGQPGEEHQRLAEMTGEWELEVRYWPMPGAEAMVMKGTSHNELILGGRFLRMEATVGEGATAAQAETILGFDRRHGEYTLLGLDTTGTYWVSARGAGDGSRARLSGEDEDPVIGHTQEYDFVLHWREDGAFVTEVVFKDDLHTQGGPPFKMVETIARRKGS